MYLLEVEKGVLREAWSGIFIFSELWVQQIQIRELSKTCMRMMYYSASDQANSEKREIRVLISGVEPKTFRCFTTELQETRGR